MRPAASMTDAAPRAGTPTLPTTRARLVLAGAAALSLAVLAGCTGADGASEWAGTVTDSAGVRVVVNPDVGLWAGTPAWSVVEEFRVGGMDAAENAQFGLVSGLDVGPDGTVYVADQQAQHVQVFGADGTHLRTLGGPGNGPGEIGQALSGVWAVDGEVWVSDMGNLRMSRYAADGSPAGSTPLDPTQGIPIRWDRIGGRLVAQLRAITPQGAPAGGGDAIVTMGADARDTLAMLPEGASFQMEGGRPRMTIFASEPVWDAAADGRLLSARNDGYRVEVRDADGALVQVVTKPFVARELTEGDETRLRAAIRRLMIAQGAPPPAVEQILGGMAFADRFPAFAQVLAGPAGTVWVQRIRDMASITSGEEDFNPQDLGSDDWDVFDAEGRYLGVMTMPDRFTPLLVEDHAFWGVQRDEFDVNSVVRFRVVME